MAPSTSSVVAGGALLNSTLDATSTPPVTVPTTPTRRPLARSAATPPWNCACIASTSCPSTLNRACETNSEIVPSTLPDDGGVPSSALNATLVAIRTSPANTPSTSTRRPSRRSPATPPSNVAELALTLRPATLKLATDTNSVIVPSAFASASESGGADASRRTTRVATSPAALRTARTESLSPTRIAARLNSRTAAALRSSYCVVARHGEALPAQRESRSHRRLRPSRRA